MDVRDLKFESGSFDFALDKGEYVHSLSRSRVIEEWTLQEQWTL